VLVSSGDYELCQFHGCRESGIIEWTIWRRMDVAAEMEYAIRRYSKVAVILF